MFKFSFSIEENTQKNFSGYTSDSTVKTMCFNLEQFTPGPSLLELFVAFDK